MSGKYAAKRLGLIIFTTFLLCGNLKAQLQIDTLALQDFEVSPASPTWIFTGPVIYNSGFSTSSATPPNSPIGIGGSRAWETTTNSGGLVLDFANQTIPSGYDSIRVHFNLAAMDLNGSGGPDDLDYVLVAVSTNGGSSYYNRLRIRGATSNNSTWAYSATGVAKLYYQPSTEVVFQPTTSGLQTTFGYSNCEIVFPGTETQIAVRITGRSSSSSDTWLIDDVIITGEKNCSPSASSITVSACDSFVAPSGAIYHLSDTYTDVIPNATGCDSTITINLTIDTLDLSISASGATATAGQSGANYQWLDCNNGFSPIAGETNQSFTAVVDGSYAVAITNNTCSDTSQCIALTIPPIPSGINGYESSAFVISQNPTLGPVTLQFSSDRNYSVRIFDVHGRLIHTAINQYGNRFTYDLSGQTVGLYLFETQLGDEVIRSKIVLH